MPVNSAEMAEGPCTRDNKLVVSLLWPLLPLEEKNETVPTCSESMRCAIASIVSTDTASRYEPSTVSTARSQPGSTVSC